MRSRSLCDIFCVLPSREAIGIDKWLRILKKILMDDVLSSVYYHFYFLSFADVLLSCFCCVMTP